MFKHLLFVASLLTACGAESAGPAGPRQECAGDSAYWTDAERASCPSPALPADAPAYCGSKGLRGVWGNGVCLPHCLPDEQIKFSCSFRLGLIAIGSPGQTAPQRFGFNVVADDEHCAHTPRQVWELTLLDPQPTNLTAGVVTPPSDKPDCMRAYALPQIDGSGSLYYSIKPVSAPPDSADW